MGIVPGTFITSTSSLLLWFALLLLSQLRLMLMPSMVSMVMVLLVPTPMPPTPTLPESFMLPRERPRPRLTQLSPTELMDMLDTHTPMDTMERDLLRLSQRLMLLFSMEPMLDTP